MTFEEKRQKYIDILKNKFIDADITDDGGLSIRLSQIGLDGVYADITKKEIEYHVENDEEDED
jgi:hypothetical protein